MERTIKKRAPRSVQACNRCRSKKYKCDGNYPCSHCKRHAVDCQFRSNHGADTAVYPINYVKSLEERLGVRQAQGEQSPPAFSKPDNAKSESAASTDLDQSLDEGGPEVNRHTSGLEFHGSTSSFAFLSRARQEYLSQKVGPAQQDDSMSLVSALHNTAFSPPGTEPTARPHLDPLFATPRAMIFLDVYFTTLHYVHPFIDKEYVYATSELIWKGQADTVRPTFINLYLGLISLGALLSLGDEPIAGIDRHEWSRMAFRAVSHNFAPGQASRTADMDTVLTQFVMAKVCQNELDLNLAWFFLGFAIRTSISIGLNRATTSLAVHTSPEQLSRAWWGMYSLELELCSSLGRGDSLADDRFHNRPLPPVADDSPYSIIPIMVRLTRMFRSVSLDIYLSSASLQTKLDMAQTLYNDLSRWQAALPEALRPGHANGALRQTTWVSIQQLILQIRYLNVVTVLMRPFLVHACKNDKVSGQLTEAARIGADAAISTIRVIYEALQSRPYFRRMWYSCTYIIFAASVLIVLLASPQPPITKTVISQQIEKSLKVLESLEECIVAVKAAEAIRSLLRPRHEMPVVQQELEIPAYSENIYDFMEQFTAPFEMTEASAWQFDLDGLGYDLRDFR